MIKNYKQKLCYDKIINNNCNYDKLCKYAHNLSEQIINPDRQFVYNIIKNKINLHNINIVDNIELYNLLILFTKLCKKCKYNKCVGGYNCKYGVNNPMFMICYTDLHIGKCNNIDSCNKIHLTKYGLNPYCLCYFDNIKLPYNISNNDKPTKYENNIPSKTMINIDNLTQSIFTTII